MSRPGRVIVSLALILGLAGCESAVSGWRSVTGVNKNDPDPQTAPFAANMVAAAEGGYPNLASVPEPPTIATSTADRQKLTDTLVAERGATAAAGSIPALTPSAAPLGDKPAPALPTTAAMAPAVTPAATTAAAAERVPGKQAANSPVPGAAGANALGATHRRQDEPPEPQPRDSALTMPTIPGPLPQPEATQPPPPSPVLPAVQAPVVAPPMPPAAVAAATPAPPPPVPVLAPIIPPPPPMPSPKAATAKSAPTKTTVATLDVAASEPGPDEHAEIDRVASLYKQTSGTVRVVGFAAAPVNGVDPLASYHAALERAQAVAKELTAAGIPSNKVQTEASPAAGAGSGRIEIQFLP
jgi:outer membrane protein OmpA-like peptidoglycan-associated protein